MEHSPFQTTKPLAGLKAALLLALLVGSVYGYTLPFPWQFDDKPNIVHNPAVHLASLTPGGLMRVLLGGGVEGGGVSRPLARLTFALNWFVGGANPAGYRLVNLLLHWLAAWCLYHVSRQILATPAASRVVPAALAPDAALLCAALWAGNPVQTQSVTYIVQRMTILATLFYLLGIWAYLAWRNQGSRLDGTRCLLLVVLCLLAGLGCKEIAITLPLAVLLMEWILFRRGDLSPLEPGRLWGALGLVALASLGIASLLTPGGIGAFMDKWYAMRPFSLGERLLTQPRILLHYLSLVLLPSPARLSIEHDVLVSTSWWTPWTTLPAILTLIAVLAAALRLARDWPLTACGLLFFFIGHGVEGSFLPLELYFEHRNYLPSTLVFLPVAVGIVQLLQSRLTHRPWARGALAAGLVCLMGTMGLGTYVRNLAWASETALWADATRKAPGSARPLNNLAVALAWRPSPSPHDLERALRILERARALTAVSSFQKAGYIANMGDIQHRLGRPQEAAALYAEALATEPGFRKARFDRIVPLVAASRWAEALQEASYLVVEKPSHPEYLKRMGSLLVWQERPNDALVFLRQALVQTPRDGSVWLLIGAALSHAGAWENGEWFLRYAPSRGAAAPVVLLSLVENRLHADDSSGARLYAEILTRTVDPATIQNHLRPGPPDLRFPPLDSDPVREVLRAAEMERLSPTENGGRP